MWVTKKYVDAIEKLFDIQKRDSCWLNMHRNIWCID